MKQGFAIISLLIWICTTTPAGATVYKAKGWFEMSPYVSFGNVWGKWFSFYGGRLGLGYARGLGVTAGGGVSQLSNFDDPYSALPFEESSYVWLGGFLKLAYVPFMSWQRVTYPNVNVTRTRYELFLEGDYGSFATYADSIPRQTLGFGLKVGASGKFVIVPSFLAPSLEVGWEHHFVDFPFPSGLYLKISLPLMLDMDFAFVRSIESPQVVVNTLEKWVKACSTFDILLTVSVRNMNGILLGFLSGYYPQGVDGPGSISLRRIGGYSSRALSVPVKILASAVPGWKNVNLTLQMKGEDDEWYTQTATARIRVVSAAAKPVAVVGLPKENLGDLIFPVSEAEAEYLASYSGTKLTILNLASGQKTEIATSSQDDAVRLLNGFFEGYDRVPPQIALSVTDKETVPAESLKVAVYVSDDQLLGSLKINLNNREVECRGLGAARESQLSFTLPLQWGDNDLRFEVTDAAGHQVTKVFTVTRIRGTGVATGTKPLVSTTETPHLTYSISSSSGTNTFVGGTVGGVVVVVRNTGKGSAQNVRVSLSGDDGLCRLIGFNKAEAIIESGDSALMTFTAYLPSDISRRQANLKVSVTEGRGYSPTEVKTLAINVIPAERREAVQELVEDVDHDIPSSGLRRSGYALIVGISTYQYTSGPPYARNDAVVFRDYAEKVLGIPATNIKLLTDAEATGGMLKAQIQDWLASKTGWKVVYFAGHGTFDFVNPLSGDAYLLPYDGDPELHSTLVSVEWMLDQIEPASGDTTLVFFDACFTGGEGRSVQVAVRPAVMAAVPKGYRSIVLASSEGHQVSFDFIKARHGLFTYYLLNGLRGNAEGEGGWIYLDRLYHYVLQNVIEFSDGKQTPVLRGDGEGIIVGKAR